jgi:hypothetical protein
LIKFYKGKDEVEYTVIVEKAIGTKPGSDNTRKKVAYIVLKSWLSVDKKFVMLPRKVANPIEGAKPKYITPEYYELHKNMPDEEMHNRYILLPFPLESGFYEVNLKS